MRRWIISLLILVLVGLLLACGPLSGIAATPTRLAAVTVEAIPIQNTSTAQAESPVAVVATPEATPTPLSSQVLEGLSLLDDALANIYDRVAPSVVNISVVVPGSGVGGGSGWVWDTQGHIVTNNHVVENADSITVRFANEMEVEATVVGTDPDADLAVIRVDIGEELLFPVEVGDSSQLRVGQMAVAIGNPFGFERTMTLGIVSAIGRVNQQASGFSQPNLIQVDTPINPGNSGGPLLDIYGRVIGVNTMIFSLTGEFSGIGFAVPVNTVKRVVPSLIATGSYQHPYLGLTGLTLSPVTADVIGIAEQRGALVETVVEGGPAERAGLRGGGEAVQVPGFARPIMRGGDIVIAMGGQSIGGMDDLITALEEYAVGDQVALTVLRDGQQTDITVTLGERPARATEPVFGFQGP